MRDLRLRVATARARYGRKRGRWKYPARAKIAVGEEPQPISLDPNRSRRLMTIIAKDASGTEHHAWGGSEMLSKRLMSHA